MSSEVTLDQNEVPTRGGVFQWIFLGLLFLSMLVLFTLVKVPQPKIHAWILGTINQQMIPMGIQVSADEGHIALGLGLKYEMTGVRLTKSVTQKTLKLSRLEVAPSILPLLQGKLGGNFRLEDEGSGSLSGVVLAKGDEFDINLALDNLDLGKMGILPFAADLEGTANLNGGVELTGTTAQIVAMTGKIDLTIKKLVIDAQKVMGFEVPRTSVGEGVISIAVGGGNATFTTFRLGKPSGTDDLNGTMSGTIKLLRQLENSEGTLKLKFAFSDRYKQEKTISLLDSLLGQYKHPDGTFGMKFLGPLSQSQPLPDP